jgi:quinol monooxygenase YgiN
MAVVEYTVTVDGNVTYFVAEDTEYEDETITETWYDVFTKIAGA